MIFLPPPKQLTIEATYIHTSELGEELFLIDKDQQQKARDEANQEIDKRKAREEGFALKQNQDIIVPRIDNALLRKKFKIDIMFD